MNRHVEALAEEFLGRGHDVRVLAPVDPPGRVSRVLHRAQAERRELPEYLTPLGRTAGFGANGSVSNLAPFPAGGVVAPRRLVRSGEFDVIHVHEPVVPLVGWNATLGARDPVVGTFHSYSTRPLSNYIANGLGARRVFNRLSARIAVSEAAAWTGRRWFGGEYTIIPNGVDVDAAPTEPQTPDGELKILFVGRSEERKGLPILLTAFNALVEHVPCRLTVIGTEREDILRYVADPELLRFMDIRGRVSREELWAELHHADLLCAPSLSGESFGMVLTEAFAAGTPVIASAIAGYSDVVSDGVDGLLVPPGDPQRLAEELQRVHFEPERLQEMGEAARRSAQRYAWPRVADQVTAVYERAIEAPKPALAAERFAHWAGLQTRRRRPQAARRAPALAGPRARPGEQAGQGRRPPPGPRGRRNPGGRPDPARRPEDRRRQGRRKHRPLQPDLGAGRLRPDGELALLPRRLLVLDRPRGAAQPPDPPPRRHLGDDDRGADVGDAAGAPRRACPRPDPGAAQRPHAGDLPGPARDPGLADDAEPVALVLLGVIIVSTTPLFHSGTKQLFAFSLVPLLVLIVVLFAPLLMRRNGNGRLARLGDTVHRALVQVRAGLTVFKDPRYGTLAAAAQLTAWAIQLAACWALLYALGLDGQAGIGAAAAVLFAVNVTAVVPATPSNIGVFQLAVISVLHSGFGISTQDALAYGVILQAVEIATAVALGLPALVREGLTWSDLRMQALQTTPVRLEPKPRARPGHPQP